MKLAIFGNYGVHNLGDDLILMGLQEQLKASHPDLMIFCGNPDSVEKTFGLRAFSFFPGGFRSFLKSLFSPSTRRSIKKSHEALETADEIIIGGGGILVDVRIKAVLLWWRQLKVIQKTGIPFRFVANSFELRQRWSRWLLLPYLRKAEDISVRDEASLRFLKSHGLSAKLVDDLAYQAPLEMSRSSQASKTICLALCKWTLGSHQLKELRAFVDDKKKEGFEVLGLAFQTLGDDDRQLYSLLDASLPVKTGLSDVLEALSHSTLLIGMRLHSLILADRFRIPAIALAYQDKVTHFMQDRGKGEMVLSAEKIDRQKLQALFEKAVAAKIQ